ncbi:MAG: hypothetical protein K1Y02_23870 [Candidatus Hydrogenedentes bacterium]|nr:hypothetical protein [Candidatus Hydrogenedentota bacterium]
MTVRIRSERLITAMDPRLLRQMGIRLRAWYETEEEILEGLRWGRRKAELLQWVRRKMQRKLTARERRCVELYYFGGLTYAQAGYATGTNASSVLRAVRRSVNKLRALAEREGVTLAKGVPKRRRCSPRQRNVKRT